MRKIFPLVLIVLFSSYCAPRKTIHKELVIEEVQKNLKDIYNFFASYPRMAEFTYLTGETQIRGSVSITKRDSEWIVVVKSPLYPGIYKILEDTIPFLAPVKEGIQKIPYRIEGSSLIFDTRDNQIVIEVENNLPVSIRFDTTMILITYTKSKTPQSVKIQLDDAILLLKFKT